MQKLVTEKGKLRLQAVTCKATIRLIEMDVVSSRLESEVPCSARGALFSAAYFAS